MKDTATIRRYLLFQIPGWIVAGGVLLFLAERQFITGQMALVLFLLWFLKDVIIYPLVWRSYDPAASRKSDRMMGATGICVQELSPSSPGYVRVLGELWRANLRENHSGIPAGTRVRVTEVRELLLVVEPDEPQAEKGPAAAENARDR